jgi:hypothetical protein
MLVLRAVLSKHHRISVEINYLCDYFTMMFHIGSSGVKREELLVTYLNVLD